MRQINYDNIIYKAFGETVVSTKYKGQAYGEGILEALGRFWDNITFKPQEIKDIRENLRKRYDIDVDNTFKKILSLRKDQDKYFGKMLYEFIEKIQSLYERGKPSSEKLANDIMTVASKYMPKILERLDKIDDNGTLFKIFRGGSIEKGKMAVLDINSIKSGLIHISKKYGSIALLKQMDNAEVTAFMVGHNIGTMHQSAPAVHHHTVYI